MNWGRGRSSGSQGDCGQCVLHHLVCRRYQSGVLPHWMGGGGGGIKYIQVSMRSLNYGNRMT